MYLLPTSHIHTHHTDTHTHTYTLTHTHTHTHTHTLIHTHTHTLTHSQLVGAAFGAAGQRCMALSTAVFVGDSKKWLPEIVERAKQLKINAGEGVRV